MKKEFPIGEYAFYAFIMVVGVETLAALDAFEWLHDFSRSHENFEMDELLLIVPVALLCLVIYSFRRSREVCRKNTQLNRARKGLEAAYAEMEELSQSKQRFMSVASHELKAPLSSAVSALKLAQDADEQETKKLTALALRGLENLQLLVNDVVRLANLSEDLAVEAATSFSIRSTLESVARIGGEPARDKGLTFELEVDDDVPERVEGNEGWTRLICLRLVANAIRSTARGSVAIHCGFRTSPRKALEIVVSDTGLGIPEDRLDTLFSPYAREGAPGGMVPGGIDLSLATAKELAERLDGSVTARNLEGGGSAFTVILPVALP